MSQNDEFKHKVKDFNRVHLIPRWMALDLKCFELRKL